jgi:drug/metabolite transporter (DMT)-like permease
MGTQVSAIAGGLAAAVVFAVGLLFATRSSRLIGPIASLAAILGIGCLLDIPLVIATLPSELSALEAAWLVVAGVGNLGSVCMAYAAFRAGPLGTGAAILATEGAFAAVVAIALGASVTSLVAVGLSVTVVGIALAAGYQPATRAPTARSTRLVVLLPVCAAVTGGVALYASGHVSHLPLPLVVLPPKLLGCVLFTVPMLATRRLRIPRAALPFVIVPGVTEVVGFVLFAWAARADVAVAAVLSSTFGAVAAVLGFLVLGERLTRWQVAGIATITMGVAGLAAVAA